MSCKYLMSSFTKSISYSCIAQRIYMSVVQQKDHSRQKKARTPGLIKSTSSPKHHIRLARRAKSTPGPCPCFQLLLLMQFPPLKYLARPTSFPCAGTTFSGMNFSLLFPVTSIATFVNSLMRSSHVLNIPIVCARRRSKVGKVYMLAGGMLRSGEGRR